MRTLRLEARMGVCETLCVDHPGPSRRLILRRSSPASRSLVQSGADGSTLHCGVSPGERFGRLSLEDFVETAFPGDGPGGPTPKRVSSREDWSISTALMALPSTVG